MAAVVGALAAAIGEMALRYSVGKKGLEAHETELADILKRLAAARAMMLQLAAEDQLAFEASQNLKKQGASADVLAAATLTAIRVPQAVAAAGAAVLDEAARAAPIANRWLLSDLVVCAELAMATVRCGICNVRINLSSVPDADERARFAGWCTDLQARCVGKVARVVPLIWGRIDNG